MSEPDDELLRRIEAQAPAEIDLTDRAHLEFVTQAAERIGARYESADALLALEHDLAARRAPVVARLAAKLARSKLLASSLPMPLTVSVVFAVFKEHRRILARAAHPHGEEFLARKLEQLSWLFDDAGIDWELVVVDDGCPEGSGRLAREIAETHPLGERVRVLFLAEAIAAGLPVTGPLESVAQSRKGGSILLGMWEAAQAERERHVVVFTDADLSTHLGQTGLLLDPILNDGKVAAIGSRRRPISVVIKRGTRNRRGRLFIYLWKKLVPLLDEVIDTQCGFKAFRADVVREVVPSVEEKGFAFDIELLARVVTRYPDGLAVVPVGWIDSEAASTTVDLQPYLPMLRAIVHMYRSYLQPSPQADGFADLISALDEASWARLVDDVPDALAALDPTELGAFDGVTAADLAEIAGVDLP